MQKISNVKALILFIGNFRSKIVVLFSIPATFLFYFANTDGDNHPRPNCINV